MSPAKKNAPSIEDLIFRDDLFDVIPFPIYVVDVEKLVIVNVNKSMREKTGAKPGDNCAWAIYRQETTCSFCRIGDMKKTAGIEPCDLVFEHFNDRDECWYQIHETLMEWRDGRIVKHSTAVDIAGLKDAQNELSEAYALLALKNIELEKVSSTDVLTGLFNRRRLDEVIEYEISHVRRNGQPLSVILTDIDRFKTVNDTYGHHVGDQVLQKVAARLREGVRSVDTVGRWGGEEFLILCPGTDLTGAQELANKLRQSIGHAFSLWKTQLTSSFGVAQHRDHESAMDLIARADAALYRAKNKGRNCVEN
jgi:diguanylate cyclase (GGDEF)-like protein